MPVKLDRHSELSVDCQHLNDLGNFAYILRCEAHTHLFLNSRSHYKFFRPN
jgi:hypothetical protein